MITNSIPLPKYFQIKQFILEQIQNGTFNPGQKIPSEPELVKKYSLGRPTIRHAIGELVQEGILIREHGRGTFVAKNCLKNGQFVINEPIVFFLNQRSLDHPYYSGLLNAVENRTQQEEMQLAVEVINNENQLQNFVEAKTNNVSGIIVTGKVDKELTDLLEVKNYPWLVAGQYENIGKVNNVYTDNSTGTYQAVKYLLEEGLAEIGLFCGEKNALSTKQQIKGYKKAFQEKDLNFNDSHIIPDISLGKGENMVSQILESSTHLSAIIADENMIPFLIGASSAVSATGKTPPFFVINGNGFLRKQYFPEHPYIDLCNLELGELAVNMMIKLIRGETKDVNCPIESRFISNPAAPSNQVEDL